MLRANGNVDQTIARVIGINVETLRKHFKAELKYGGDHVKAIVGAAVVRAALAGNVAAQKFWLTQFGGPEWQRGVPEDDGDGRKGLTQIIIKGGLPAVVQRPQTIDETGEPAEEPPIELDDNQC